MKRKLSILLLLLGGMMSFSAYAAFSDESLNYNISYKWGLVQKNAGTVKINLRSSGDNYRAILTARTDPWADKFYVLRDTLTSVFSKSTMIPSEYIRIAHEGGHYAKDRVVFTKNGNNFSGTTTTWRKGKKDTAVRKGGTSLSATGMTVDMLSTFFYMRNLGYENMKPGERHTINIFSGKKKENMTITYKGREKIKVNGRDYDCFKVLFTFTSEGRKQTSEPIDAWISSDARRLPVKIEGSVKIGKVRCIYAGG